MRSAASPMRNRSNPVIVLAAGGAPPMGGLFGGTAARGAVVARVRPAISPGQVQIYLQPPESKYDEIANLSASSRGYFSLTAAGKIDKIIERLKKQAAKLGGKGISLQ